MTAALTFVGICLAYMAGGLLLLLAAGAVFHRRVDAYIDRHVRRALREVVPFRQSSHVRRVESKIAIPRRLG